MNAYTFIRTENNFTKQMPKNTAYEARIVALQITTKYEKQLRDYKEEPHYKECKNAFLDSTMSCSTKEAVGWMNYYMANAIAYGKVTKNTDWELKFMAAYDIFNSLANTK